MMNVDDGWAARMRLARSQNRWRRQVAETRQTARRNQVMAENYADHLRRQRLVARAYEAEAARQRQTPAHTSRTVYGITPLDLAPRRQVLTRTTTGRLSAR
jgi:hypothetical protein